jgi:DNA polymerase-1
MATSRTLLSEINSKEWYYNSDTGDIEWRVPDIREIIHAKPNHKILAADYSQIEVKIMGFLSQDPDLIAAINSGKDIHSYIATSIFGTKLNFDYDLMVLAKSDKKHPRHIELDTLRSRTKATTFGTPYGAGASKVALMTGMSIDEAQEFIDAYMGRYPKLKAWLEKEGDNAIKQGFSTDLYGRKRFYTIPDISERDYDKIISQIRRWAGNFPIQATNADMLKLAMRLIYLRIRGGKANGKPIMSGRFKLVVHDEIVMEWNELEVELGKKVMSECMMEAYYMLISGIKNKVDVMEGNSWIH